MHVPLHKLELASVSLTPETCRLPSIYIATSQKYQIAGFDVVTCRISPGGEGDVSEVC